MTKLEKVIKGLESIHAVALDKEQLYVNHMSMKDFNELLADALALLKEREARVLTLEEALGLDEDLCWIEINVDGADRNFGRWNDLYLYVTPDGISIVSEWAGQKNYLDAERYGKTWRCWNTRPTDEQRKATPWD